MPNATRPDPDHVLMFTPSGAWAPATPNIHTGVHGYAASHSVGPDMTFARALVSEGMSQRVGLIPTAKGGSSMSDWRPGGELYGFLLEQARAAVQLAPQGRLRGVVWVQVRGRGGGEGSGFGRVAQGGEVRAAQLAPQGRLRGLVWVQVRGRGGGGVGGKQGGRAGGRGRGGTVGGGGG